MALDDIIFGVTHIYYVLLGVLESKLWFPYYLGQFICACICLMELRGQQYLEAYQFYIQINQLVATILLPSRIRETNEMRYVCLTTAQQYY